MVTKWICVVGDEKLKAKAKVWTQEWKNGETKRSWPVGAVRGSRGQESSFELEGARRCGVGSWVLRLAFLREVSARDADLGVVKHADGI